MGIKEKIINAESTNWLTENMTNEQVEEIMTEVKEKVRERIKIYNALDNLKDFDSYSPYQKDLSIVIDYIEDLEQEIEDLKEAKAVYVEHPKTIQEKQAESEKYDKAFDDGYENGYSQTRFDYEQQPRGKWIKKWCEWQEYIECSECGYETGLRCNTKFCPNCGADMRGDCE